MIELLFALVALVSLFTIGIFIGFKVEQRYSIDYKKRWLEALGLVKQLEAGDDETDPTCLRWKLLITYGCAKLHGPITVTDSTHPYAWFYAQSSQGKKVLLGHTRDYAQYPANFKDDCKAYKNVIKDMNNAEKV